MKYTQNIIANNTITLARACLALSVLGTLLFTPIYDLFPEHYIETLETNVRSIGKFNLFFLFDNLYIGYGVAVAILLLVISGVAPRITCWLHCWVTYSYFYGMLIVEGGDQINAILTLLLLPICVIDPRLNGWKNEVRPERLPTWLHWNARCAIAFIAIQMALLYLNAGTAKASAPEWYNGTAVYYWFTDNMFGAPEWLLLFLNPVIQHPIGVSILTWGVIATEIFFFVALFLPQRYKYRAFFLAVLFHFAIVMVHGLTSFWMAMSGGLILYLLRIDISISENWAQMRGALRSVFTSLIAVASRIDTEQNTDSLEPSKL